ncbi:MAG: hypothetical protein FD181_2004 [Prolixibacteraceae bacterium]|nr:MAG: hypothetical protein FD181_2004 [Prolixibacteraceae bacterium]
MNDFENDFEQYLKHLDLVEKNDPEKYEYIKEIADSIKDIDLSKLIEKIALSFEKSKNEYSEITGKAGREIFAKEQIELYIYANHRFKRFGEYSNATFDKYQPIFIEALDFWKKEHEFLKQEHEFGTVFKDIDSWVEWLTINPELAEKYYPNVTNGLKERIQKSPPFQMALIIQKLPDHFPKWKTKAEKYFGTKRKKIINGYINLIKTVLFEYEYPGEIEQQAIESVRAELTEQLEYWENDIKNLPPQPIETKTELTLLNLKIGKAFGFMKGNDPRKHEKILNETDFNNLIEWITYFFENNFEVPRISEPIKKVNTSKGNVIYTFMSFYKSEHPAKTRPDSLFELIKACFKEYRNDELDNLKKTKKPQYYDVLINDNK